LRFGFGVDVWREAWAVETLESVAAHIAGIEQKAIWSSKTLSCSFLLLRARCKKLEG
jgi:hypothetical protein